MSVRELQLMGTLQFRAVSERCFAHLTSPAMWGKARVEFITSNSGKISGQAIPVVVLVMDGVGEGNLGMVTTFCHLNQAKVEAFKVLSALCQHDSPEASEVVGRRFTNSLYLHGGSFGFLYLDMTTLSRGASSTQFLLNWLHLCRLLPAMGGGGGMFKGVSLLPGQSSEEEHCLSDPILLLVPLSPPIPI